VPVPKGRCRGQKRPVEADERVAADRGRAARQVRGMDPRSAAAPSRRQLGVKVNLQGRLGIFFTSLPSSLDANHRPLEDEKRRAAQGARRSLRTSSTLHGVCRCKICFGVDSYWWMTKHAVRKLD